MGRFFTTIAGPAVPVLLAAALLGGCSSGDRTADAAHSGSSTTTAAPATSAPISGPATTTSSSSTPPDHGTATSGTGSAAGADACGDLRSWTTDPQTSAPLLDEDLNRVRVGRHRCYDRMVFDLNSVVPGPDVAGYGVSYVDGEVTADPSGEPVPTAGAAALQVVVRAPIWGTNGHGPSPAAPAVGDDVVPATELAGLATFEQISYAGSFEGTTTIAVGLPARLSFRAGSFERDGYTFVYVDVAHPA